MSNPFPDMSGNGRLQLALLTVLVCLLQARVCPLGTTAHPVDYFFSLELERCGLSCCSSAFTQVLASPASTTGEYKLGWARHSSGFEGNGSGVEARPATALSRIVKSLMTAQVLSPVPNEGSGTLQPPGALLPTQISHGASNVSRVTTKSCLTPGGVTTG